MKLTDIKQKTSVEEASPTATGPQGRMQYNKLKTKEELAKTRKPVYDKDGKVTGFKKIKKVKEAGPIATDTRGRSNTRGMPLNKKRQGNTLIPLDKAFGPDDEKLAAERKFLLDEFAKDLDHLVNNAIEDAFDIAGEFKGPGLAAQLEKILKSATMLRR